MTVTGKKVKNDNEGTTDVLRPIWLEAKRGDALRVVAKDVRPSARKLSDVFLN